MINRNLSPIKIVIYFLAFSLLWILSSDLLLSQMTREQQIYTAVSIIKGWIYVILAAAFLYWMLIMYSKQKTQAENALLASKEQFRTLVEKSPLAMALVNSEGVIEYINLKAIDIFGYLPQDIPNMDRWWVQAYPDKKYRDEVIAKWSRLVSEALANRREIERREYRVTCKNGSVKVVSIYGVWVEDKVLVVFEDITERKQNEKELRDKESKYRSLFESANDGIFILDETGFIDCNKRGADMYGLTKEQLLGRSPADLSPERQPDGRSSAVEFASVMGKVINGEPQQLEWQSMRSDGTLFAVEITLSRIDLGDRVCLQCIARDITERKLAEEQKNKLQIQLSQTQKLESIGILAGGIAHDFNNLLQGVFGYISLAELTYDKKEKSLAMLREAEKALNMAVNLTNQLLTFSKGGQPVKQHIKPAPLVENSLRFALSGSNSNYSISVMEGLWDIDADGGQLVQVIHNIVFNATEAMAGGGTVNISMSNVETSSKNIAGLPEGNNFVRLDIQDTGTGIPDQIISRIFDPYFTTKQMGSGLGLATSYAIIKNHGGIIEVKSEVSKGTTFSIYLPAVEEPEPIKHELSPEQHSSCRSCRVLLMDDDEVIRNVATAMIETLGHEIEDVSDGEAAIESFKRARETDNPFDLVILDLTVRGGMGGEDALRILREIDPDVVAIVSSGYAASAAVARYKDYGFSAFLKKPYTIDELRNCFNSLLL